MAAGEGLAVQQSHVVLPARPIATERQFDRRGEQRGHDHDDHGVRSGAAVAFGQQRDREDHSERRHPDGAEGVLDDPQHRHQRRVVVGPRLQVFALDVELTQGRAVAIDENGQHREEDQGDGCPAEAPGARSLDHAGKYAAEWSYDPDPGPRGRGYAWLRHRGAD